MRQFPACSARWRRVGYLALNPLALLPVAGVAAYFGINVAGDAFGGLTAGAGVRGLLYSIPLLILSLLPLEKLPGLSSLREVTEVSKFITLICLGAERGVRPAVRAAAAAMIVSVSAGVAEELVFRGCLQTSLTLAIAKFVPLASGAQLLAIVLSSGLFGLLHSYSSTRAYQIAAVFASSYFGLVYWLTGDIAVPIVVHILVDATSFLTGYLSLIGESSDQRRLLWRSDQPLAKKLRLVLGLALPGDASPQE